MVKVSGEKRRGDRAGYKPREVEEPIDLWVHRPLATLLVRLFVRLPVTANQVTVASGATGLLAGVTVAIGCEHGPWWVLAGGCVALLSVLLDCADGQLARLRGTSSMFGRALDGFMDIAAPLSVFLGWGCYLLAQGYRFSTSWPVGIAAAASLAWHAAHYDAVKNVYLHCSRPDVSLGGATLLTAADIEAVRREREAAGDRFQGLVLRVWSRWTRAQSQAVAPWLGSLAPGNRRERALFTELFEADMRRWSWLGFGTHMMLLQLMCWATPWSDLAIWAGWGVMLGPMNLYCLLLRWRRERLLSHYRTELAVLRGEPQWPGTQAAPAGW